MARILVVGAGVVGNATGLGLMAHNNDVTFADTNPSVIASLNGEGYPAVHPNDVDLNSFDAVFVSVTALTGETGIDLSHLLAATDLLGRQLQTVHDGHFPVIVFRCTLPPGTVRQTLVPLLEELSGRRCEGHFGVVYMPEFLRAATACEDFIKPRAIVLSSLSEADRAHKFILQIMQAFDAPVTWMSIEEAELLKYVNNVFNAVKITFFNLMRAIAARLDINPALPFALSAATAEGMYNPLYGTRDHGPFGGVCLPKDTKALYHWAAELGIDVTLLDAVLTFNNSLARKEA